MGGAVRPTLVAFVDGSERARLAPPAAIEGRAWMLAVAAVQARIDGGRVRAQLRVHVTGGAAPTVVELGSRARVDIALVEPGGRPGPLPELAGPAGAGIALAVDGQPVAAAAPPDLAPSAEAARAFGHVYSRWLRAGGSESGYDLTGFQAPAPGVKYDRLASADAVAGQLISYVISAD